MENVNNPKSIITIIDPYNKFTVEQHSNFIEVIYDQLVKNSDVKYLEVKVKPVAKKNQEPDHFIAYLAHATIYYFEMLKFKIEGGQVTSLQSDFDEDAEDDDCEEEDDADDGIGLGDEIQFVVGTAFKEVPSAVLAVNTIAQIAEDANLKALTLIGEEANAVAYKKYFTTASVVGFCNIGHGSEQGIMVYDGAITYKWFDTLSQGELGPKVIYFNSCNTYNNPLWKSIMEAQPRTYIASAIELAVGTSEELTTEFWEAVLEESKAMLSTINQINLIKPDEVNFSLAGDGGIFFNEDIINSSGEGQVDADDQLVLEGDLDWSGVQPLEEPIQTTPDDVIFSGHGAFTFETETKVPEGMEFWVLAPLGASIADSLGQSLESMDKISELGLKNKNSNKLITVFPTVYAAGSAVPNYVLSPPRGIIIKPGGPHIIGVEQKTKLSDLWVRAEPFKKQGETLKIYWAACTALKGASNPVVLGQ